MVGFEQARSVLITALLLGGQCRTVRSIEVKLLAGTRRPHTRTKPHVKHRVLRPHQKFGSSMPHLFSIRANARSLTGCVPSGGRNVHTKSSWSIPVGLSERPLSRHPPHVRAVQRSRRVSVVGWVRSVARRLIIIVYDR